MTQFSINSQNLQNDDCLTGLFVKKGHQDGEYDITLLNCSSDKQEKHKLHSLSQIALYQYEDQEIDIHRLNGCCTITGSGFDYAIDEGLVLIQDTDNKIAIYAHPAVSVKKSLEKAYRYCTRWIRLDI